MTTTTIRARGPRELLSYVPYRLGYRPHESVVLVSLRGPRHAVGLVARADVADLVDPDDGERLARALAGHAASDGADRVVVAVWTGEAPGLVRPGGAGDAARAVDRVRAAVARVLGTATDDVEAWAVGADGYRAVGCVDDACCPPAGRPAVELESSEVSAHMVLRGVGVAPSRAASFAIPPADTRRRTAARRAAVRQEQAAARSAGDAAATVRRRDEALDVWGRAVALSADRPADRPTDLPVDLPTDLPAVLLGRLAQALAETPVRDAVLLAVCGADRGLVRRTARGTAAGATAQDGAATAGVVARLVDPRAAQEPDEALTGPARTVLEAVVAHVPGRAAPALTLLALLAWWNGDGGRAGQRLAEALALDPGHRLALLLDGALEAGLPPGWVRRETAAVTGARRNG